MMIPSVLFGELPFLKIMFRLTLPDHSGLPSFLGSTWRGLIGWELQRLICPFDRRPLCTSCTIHSYCPYFLLFEEQTSLPGLSESPRGYICYPPISESCLFVTLIGRSVRFLPILAAAVFKGQKIGLGKKQIPYTITSWAQMLPHGNQLELPTHPDGYTSITDPAPLSQWLKPLSFQSNTSIAIHIETPVRLRKQGQYVGNMDWQFFFASVARRLEALNVVLHNGKPFGKELWEQLNRQFANLTLIRSDLKWLDYVRYSNRQKTKIPMGGLIGKAVFETNDWISEWLQTAELVHVGKGSSMGLGKLSITQTEVG